MQREDGYKAKLRELIARSNLLALETLETLLNVVTPTGVDFLINEQKTLLRIAEREWQGEMNVEVELDVLHTQEPEMIGHPVRRAPDLSKSAAPVRPSVGERPGLVYGPLTADPPAL